MTAASADREAYGVTGEIYSGTVATGKEVFKDTMVGYDSSGNLEPKDSSGNVFAGVAMEGGTAGETIRFYRKGVYEMVFSSASIAYLGDKMYSVDDQTVTSSSANSATEVGRAARYDNSGKIGVDIGGLC